MFYLMIAVGGALGSVARAWMGSQIDSRLTGGYFPWGTITINIVGSFLIGLFAAWAAIDGRIAGSDTLRAFLMVGICGGFTTFSSFSLQTLNLLQQGRFAAAVWNIGLSVLVCLAAVALGYRLGLPAK